MPTGQVPAGQTSYAAETFLWRAAEGNFGGWRLAGVTLSPGGELMLDPAAAQRGHDPFPAGEYNVGNFYNGGEFLVGEAISPVIDPSFAFTQAIASWNASTPDGSWLEVQLRTRTGSRWTRWYNMGVWASGTQTVTRHSVSGQRGPRASVETDTLVLGNTRDASWATAIQMKLRLFSSGDDARPGVRNAAVAVSTTPAPPAVPTTGDPALWGKSLDVPECSQMVYPDGGNVWCSPTAVSMALAYWTKDKGACEGRVRQAVSAVYDAVYDGHGNWSFNAAYAAMHGLDAFIARFTGMDQLEPWIAAGVPVVISYGWKEGQLANAPVRSSSGHLGVLCGFDAEGNPVVNDPAAPNDKSVRRTYGRSELESLWLRHSGGAAYVIYPPNHPNRLLFPNKP